MRNDQSVEERLRDYGHTLDQAIGELEPKGSESGSSVRWLVAAAAALVAIGGLFSVLREPSNLTETGTDVSTDPTQPAETTSVPDADERTTPTVPPAPDPQTFQGTQACRDHLGKIEAEMGTGSIGAPFDPTTSVREVVILALPDSPASVLVLLLGDEGFIRCRMLRTATSTVSDFSFSGGDPYALPDAGGIRLIDQGWTSREREAGPGTVLAVGRVGSEVTAVEIELPDGTRLPGLVTEDGWFSIDGRVPSGVPIFRERINWTTEDGVTNSALTDELRDLTPAEQCRQSAQCVSDRLDQLLASAQDLGLTAQLAVLEDRVVSDAEYSTVLAAYVECLTTNGIDAELIRPDDAVAVSGALSDDRETARQVCEEQHASLVSEAVGLLGLRRSGLGEAEATVFEELQLTTLDGETVRLANLSEERLLVFTGSWLGHPDGTNPSLEAVRRITEQTGLNVFFVATTDPQPAKLEQQVRAQGFETPILLLEDDRTAQQLGLRGYPTTFFVDGDGSVAQIWVGMIDPEVVADYLESVLGN